MRLLIKLLLTLLILAVILPFTPFMPGGKPLMQIGDLKWPRLVVPAAQDITDSLKSRPSAPSSKNKTFFKWRDAQGNIHFSDKPPKEKTAHLETIEVNPDANLIQGVRVPPPPQPQQTVQTTPQADIPSPYAPGQIKRLFDEAHKIKQQAEKRNKQLEELNYGDTLLNTLNY
ncbi:MAG: DUF4124 domain-containing protein [Gammaproteobacteria bacterium]|nr:DUF4124 domain-containing protein [Gammaproteobacteria bacterium]MBU1654929.1 DUF4124 domain-containing protein [Gammaproteobacteria bacterium]MBU1962384.1 DUF4124 domain-containing protein [Gammaproteobacteria bacterium]